MLEFLNLRPILRELAIKLLNALVEKMCPEIGLKCVIAIQQIELQIDSNNKYKLRQVDTGVM
jgi:hypothetical protein